MLTLLRQLADSPRRPPLSTSTSAYSGPTLACFNLEKLIRYAGKMPHPLQLHITRTLLVSSSSRGSLSRSEREVGLTSSLRSPRTSLCLFGAHLPDLRRNTTYMKLFAGVHGSILIIHPSSPSDATRYYNGFIQEP